MNKKLKAALFFGGLFFLWNLCAASDLDSLENVEDVVGELQNPENQSQKKMKTETLQKDYQEPLLAFRGSIIGVLNYADHYQHENTSDSQLSTFEFNLQLDFKPHPIFWVHTDFGFKTFDGKGSMYQAYNKNLGITNEGFLALQLSHINFTLGKKRVVIGSGAIVNPLDLFNPQKNMPGQPEPREGTYLGSLNFTMLFDSQAVSQIFADLIFFPGVTKDSSTGLMKDFTPDRDAYLMRAGGVFYKSDLAFYLMEKWQTLFWGFTGSRYVSSNLELHLEFLFFNQRKPVLEGLYQNQNKKFYQNTLIGLRYTLKQKCILGLEYYYQSDALSKTEWETDFNGPLRQVSLLKLARNTDIYEKNPSLTLRRHYILGNLSWLDMLQDLNLTLNLYFSPEDSGSMVFPKFNYMPNNRSIVGFGAIFLFGRPSRQQYDDMPFEYMLVFDLTLSF